MGTVEQAIIAIAQTSSVLCKCIYSIKNEAI